MPAGRPLALHPLPSYLSIIEASIVLDEAFFTHLLFNLKSV
jgi:hypothetical protein